MINVSKEEVYHSTVGQRRLVFLERKLRNSTHFVRIRNNTRSRQVTQEGNFVSSKHDFSIYANFFELRVILDYVSVARTASSLS